MSDDIQKKFALGKINYAIMAGGVLIVILGFFMMAGGGSEDPTQFNADELFSDRRITYAPITVLLGYIVVIFSIMWRPKSKA